MSNHLPLPMRSGKCPMRMAVRAAAMLLAVPAAAPLIAAQDDQPVPLAALVERYRVPGSRFVDAGGVRVHYTDTGRGPVVVLLHGSFLDLQVWDDWVRALSPDHRVIRIDRLGAGLTAADPEGRVGYRREHEMLDAVIAALDLRRFALVGASSGGIVAADYAARRPDRVRRLILMNFPIGHARIAANNEAMTAAIAERRRLGFQNERYTSAMLDNNLIDRRAVTPALVRRLTNYANRRATGEDARVAAATADYAEQDRVAMLKRIKAPTLVMWSEQNRTLALPNGQAAFAAIGAPDKHFSLVRNAGHMVPIEAGPATANVARLFLAGKRPPATIEP